MSFTPIRAGDLNRQITIEREVPVDNGRGGRTVAWQPIDKPIWAELLPLRGDEALSLGLTRSTQIWRATIRYREDITPKDRIRWGNIVIDIKSAFDPFGRRDRIVITGESGLVS